MILSPGARGFEAAESRDLRWRSLEASEFANWGAIRRWDWSAARLSTAAFLVILELESKAKAAAGAAPGPRRQCLGWETTVEVVSLVERETLIGGRMPYRSSLSTPAATVGLEGLRPAFQPLAAFLFRAVPPFH
ncbi:hypothetical protein VTJ04DRAFT_1169 [Mycothermus thermophilus]|uniref:uncharacterized protein n=1 Tax=Humicola insolens TaxID=85995 RepID=UPI00374451AB